MSVLLEADYTYPHCLCLIVTKETGYDFLIEAEYPIREYHVVFQKWLRVSCHRVNTKSSFVGFLKLLVPGNCFCSIFVLFWGGTYSISGVSLVARGIPYLRHLMTVLEVTCRMRKGSRLYYQRKG